MLLVVKMWITKESEGSGRHGDLWKKKRKYETIHKHGIIKAHCALGLQWGRNDDTHNQKKIFYALTMNMARSLVTLLTPKSVNTGSSS